MVPLSGYPGSEYECGIVRSIVLEGDARDSEERRLAGSENRSGCQSDLETLLDEGFQQGMMRNGKFVDDFWFAKDKIIRRGGFWVSNRHALRMQETHLPFTNWLVLLICFSARPVRLYQSEDLGLMLFTMSLLAPPVGNLLHSSTLTNV